MTGSTTMFLSYFKLQEADDKPLKLTAPLANVAKGGLYRGL